MNAPPVIQDSAANFYQSFSERLSQTVQLIMHIESEFASKCTYVHTNRVTTGDDNSILH
jgi:hypothetical protein